MRKVLSTNVFFLFLVDCHKSFSDLVSVGDKIHCANYQSNFVIKILFIPSKIQCANTNRFCGQGKFYQKHRRSTLVVDKKTLSACPMPNKRSRPAVKEIQ
jgi:hypothetical protein